jgi:hypothetical protein
MPPSVAVVVPVYNEAGFIREALPALIRAVDSVLAEHIIYIVENGSSDDTASLAREAAGDAPVVVMSLDAPDYGAAMRAGFLEADADWVVNFDIDYFSADFLDTVLSQPDDVALVIGSKRDAGSEDRRPWLRRVATFVFNILLRTILHSHVSDTHGMKGFRRSLVKDLVPQVRSTKDLFDTELVVRAERAGYRIVEVPVVVEEIRSARSSILKRVPRTLAGLFAIRRSLS